MSQERYYIAYGSNLNLEQMKRRCPTATVVGKSEMKGWKLCFRGGLCSAVATLEPERKSSVPVLVWRITPRDELALDLYEGWPHLYRKETLPIRVDGTTHNAMIYLMNENMYPYDAPDRAYYQSILAGYRAAGFDLDVLRRGALRAWEMEER